MAPSLRSSSGTEASANDSSSASTKLSAVTISNISNGLCTFNPTSRRGKWIFLLQTVLLSFTPILILLVQNGFMFNDMLLRKDQVLEKDRMVTQASRIAEFVLDLQKERSSVAFRLYTSSKSGSVGDLNEVYERTDKTLNNIQWREFGNDKIFTSKLRFQIKLDDFREFVDKKISNDTAVDANDQDILDFYNLATSKVLNSLEKEMGIAQSAKNWRLIMTYFNMIKIIESTGIGLVYGLRFYGRGHLTIREMVTYVQQNALVLEYYRQAVELVPRDIGSVLDALYEGEGFKIVASSSYQILDNVLIDSDYEKGRLYFEGCTKFTNSLVRVLDMITDRIRGMAAEDLYDSLLTQVWGCFLLVIVLLISPLLIVLAKNAITTIQIFATSVENKAVAMKKQQYRQNKLIYKMLPKVVVDKIKAGKEVAETFESASLYFSSVVDFTQIANASSALEVVGFLNNLYNVMDSRMDQFDVYKVETISDSYLVVSGLPKRNGDRHAVEICAMALNLQAACGLIVRPDRHPTTIQIKSGIHTGAIIAGIVGTKMPRYCLFGDTINMASRMQSHSMPGKVQISPETKMMLDMVGGFTMTERGTIEIKGKGMVQTYWLESLDRK